MNILNQAINIASSMQTLMSVKQIIWTCHRSLLPHNGQKEIDLAVTIGSYDKANICKVLLIWILSKLTQLRDDSLIVFKNCN